MAQAPQQFATVLSRSDTSSRGSVRFLSLLPIFLIGAIFWTAPNYDFGQPHRTTPFGGDFLQDWVGGYIVSSEQSRQLYDLDYFRSVQHDESLVGFDWPVEKYYPPIYPPFYYLVVSPLSTIDYRVAAIVWGVLSALALVATGGLLIRFYPPCRPYIGYGIVLAMLFAPLLTCLNIGHKSTFLLLILTSAFLLLYHKRPRTAGLVFGLIAFKPHLVLIILAAMLLKRQWNFVLGAFITITILIALSTATGLDVCANYVQVVLGVGDYVHTGGYDLADAHSLWGAVQNGLQGQSVYLVNGLTIVLSMIVLGLLAVVLKGPLVTDSPRFAFQFAALVLVTVLLSPHLYFYDLTMLLLPLLLILVAKGSIPQQMKKLVGYMILFSVLMLFGAGTFTVIAEYTRIQPSVILLAGLIGVMAVVFQQLPVEDSLDRPNNRKRNEPDCVGPLGL